MLPDKSMHNLYDLYRSFGHMTVCSYCICIVLSMSYSIFISWYKFSSPVELVYWFHRAIFPCHIVFLHLCWVWSALCVVSCTVLCTWDSQPMLAWLYQHRNFRHRSDFTELQQETMTLQRETTLSWARISTFQQGFIEVWNIIYFSRILHALECSYG